MSDNDGYELKVGDKILINNRLTKPTAYTVHRVTKNYAFVMWNDIAEGKFPRVVDWRFQSLPRHQFNMNTYEVIRHE